MTGDIFYFEWIADSDLTSYSIIDDFTVNPYFFEGDFKNEMTAKDLVKVIHDDLVSYSFPDEQDEIKWLNEMLEKDNWYSVLRERRKVKICRNNDLKKAGFDPNTDLGRQAVRRRNRLALEAAYPRKCPKSRKRVLAYEMPETNFVNKDRSKRGKHYFPLKEEPSLFRIFSEVSPTEEGILEFAQKYGLLGFDITSFTQPNSGEYANEYLAIESLNAWIIHIKLMKETIKIWEMTKGLKIEEIQEILQIKGDTAFSKPFWPEEFEHKKDPLVSGYLGEKIEEIKESLLNDDIILLAKDHIKFVIDANLKKLVSVGIKWLGDKHPKPALYCIPRSLIGALWFQFGMAICGNAKYKRCKRCEKWFEVLSANSNKLYCSGSCRFKAYRERKKGKETT